MRKQRAGFTMIELLVTLMIAGIITITAVPALVSYFQTNRLTGTTNGLYHALRYARMEALKRNTNVYVSFQTGSDWCYGINPSSACSCSNASSCTLGTRQAPTSGTAITLATTGVSNNAIRFEPNHGAANSSSTLTFTTANGTTMSVKVGLLGSLIVCSSSVSGYPACS